MVRNRFADVSLDISNIMLNIFFTVNDCRQSFTDNGEKLYACQTLITGSQESFVKVSSSAKLAAIALFLLILISYVASLTTLRKLLPILFPEELGDVFSTISVYIRCKTVLVCCVEAAGLFLIASSTTNHDVIINSTAAFFIGELDSYILYMLLNYALLYFPVEGEGGFDVTLLDLELNTLDLPEKVRRASFWTKKEKDSSAAAAQPESKEGDEVESQPNPMKPSSETDDA